MWPSMLALLAQLDLRDRGGDLIPDKSLQTDPTPYLILFVAGFVIGAFGHLTKVKFLIALGVLMVALATVILPVAYAIRAD